MLALGAVKGRSAALDDAPDSAATSAEVAFTIVDRKARREIAELSVWLRIIAKRGAARLDGFGYHLADRLDQPAESVGRQLPRRPLRMDSGAVKRLARIDVAKAGDDPLVEQKRLDRRASSPKPLPQRLRVERHRLASERRDRGP